MATRLYDHPITRPSSGITEEDLRPAPDYCDNHMRIVNRGDSSGRDWMPTLTLILGLLLQFGGTVWYFSKMDSRVEANGARISTLEKRETDQENQASDIAVMKSQIGDIKAWVDRQDTRRGSGT